MTGMALLFSPMIANTARAVSDAPLNVLFIAVDDLRNDLGCYGHPLVKSPHMDRLAARGVRFDRAYCQYPICNASRASVMTGLRPDSTGVDDNRKNNVLHFRTIVPDVVTLPQLFMQHGYFSARVGKIYHYGVPREIGTVSAMDDEASWNLALYPRGVEKDEEHLLKNCTPRVRSTGIALAWHASDTDPLEHTDGKVATEAIRLMEENKDRPFFLAVGFYRPHVPAIAPRRYFDLYRGDQVRLPIEPPEHFERIPKAALDPQFDRSRFVPDPQADCLADFRLAYYATVSFVDEQIGRVVDALDRLGLAERTVIVLWGDHGWMLGEHRQWEKRSLFEESAKAPLFIYAPGMKGNGSASRRVVEFVDMYPTIAELCGLPLPAGLEGKSLTPLLANPETAWNRPAYTQVARKDVEGRSVRTGRWRYTEWNGGKDGSELYDHDSDPNEYNNLAGDSKHQRVVAQMQQLVRRPNE
jgi:uncharacterized sulfatase